MQKLKKELQGLASEEREPIVLNALVEALKENSANYVLPFKFYRTDYIGNHGEYSQNRSGDCERDG